jgi:small subunit ribosomal protein S1
LSYGPNLSFLTWYKIAIHAPLLEVNTMMLSMQKVFTEAEEMAKKYREKMPLVATSPISDRPPITSSFPQGKDEEIYANWEWFKFESQ